MSTILCKRLILASSSASAAVSFMIPLYPVIPGKKAFYTDAALEYKEYRIERIERMSLEYGSQIW
jgi:hypothetical protein